MRIEICGNIASGKTTLANLFKKKGNVLFEEYEANPFWAAFYSNPQKFKFETEIAFLLQHYHLIKRDFRKDEINICDFSFLLDYSYALSDLDDRELEIFKDVHSKIIDELEPPDVLIYLKCDIETLVDRIRNRGRKEEENIDIDFLELIERNILSNLENKYATQKRIEIDSKANDFAHVEGTKHKVVEYILADIKPILH